MGGNRFTALDGWRGIAACMVVLFHVRAPSHVSELALVRNSFLFVDFFFVLSGFVIAATYAERLAGGLGIGRFMLLADKWAGDVLIALCLMLVIAVAAFTYRCIEVRAREWFRRRAQAVREPGLLHTASD